MVHLGTSVTQDNAAPATDAPDFRPTVEAELEAKSYVDDVLCNPLLGE